MTKWETWLVTCEFCDWHVEWSLRKEAVTAGHKHVQDEHSTDDEYAFRVRGFREPEGYDELTHILFLCLHWQERQSAKRLMTDRPDLVKLLALRLDCDEESEINW